jgi:hypothetical protein
MGSKHSAPPRPRVFVQVWHVRDDSYVARIPLHDLPPTAIDALLSGCGQEHPRCEVFDRERRVVDINGTLHPYTLL